MVSVNRKPQYLVFCSHSRHPHSKHRIFACGKRKWPCRMRVPRCPIASSPVQMRLAARWTLSNTSLCCSRAACKAAKRCKIGAICAIHGDSWRFPGRLSAIAARRPRNQSRPIPKPRRSSRRNPQAAATLHKSQQDTVTLVPLWVPGSA